MIVRQLPGEEMALLQVITERTHSSPTPYGYFRMNQIEDGGGKESALYHFTRVQLRQIVWQVLTEQYYRRFLSVSTCN